ncbi:MAG: flagellar biosynthetic protein FliR [Alphaproteobacteria bacterium]|nr:flagellar biosynthetic protein FliR [Alphaproteobacteria bacterium]
MLADLLAGQVWSIFLVFARFGAAFAVMPAFSEVFVPVRVRLLLAGAVTFAVAPAIAGMLPALPAEPLQLAFVAGLEVAIGIFLGLIARLTLAAAHIAGLVIGYQTSLANAFAFDPSTHQQGVITSAWMSTLAIVVVMAGDLHHVLLRALVDSYAMFPAGHVVDPGEFAEAATQMLGRSFGLGVRMAMPFLVYGIVLFLALGLMQRLMPQLQVFFVAMPLQLALGFVLLAMTTGLAMMLFVEEVETGLGSIIRMR